MVTPLSFGVVWWDGGRRFFVWECGGTLPAAALLLLVLAVFCGMRAPLLVKAFHEVLAPGGGGRLKAPAANSDPCLVRCMVVHAGCCTSTNRASPPPLARNAAPPRFALGSSLRPRRDYSRHSGSAY